MQAWWNLLLAATSFVAGGEWTAGPLPACRDAGGSVVFRGVAYPLYPSLVDSPPAFLSPWRAADAREYVVIVNAASEYGVVDATLEDCAEKGTQLLVDKADFPTLARTGLHSESELARTVKITGRPVEEITKLGRARGLSWEGFLAPGEDVVAVMLADNRLVGTLGLTHSHMARPLFHVLNAVLSDSRFPAIARRSAIEALSYNGRRVSVDARGTKGGQTSIFDDGITGSLHIRIDRRPEPGEERLLRAKYGHLGEERMEALIRALSHVELGEIQPQYIMRYGFYEGHTLWRADPIAIAFIFGLRKLADIENAFAGRLDRVLLERSAGG
jgi:hypothetical protein